MRKKLNTFVFALSLLGVCSLSAQMEETVQIRKSAILVEDVLTAEEQAAAATEEPCAVADHVCRGSAATACVK